MTKPNPPQEAPELGLVSGEARPDKTYTIEGLLAEIPPPEQKLHTRLFARIEADRLLQQGKQVETEDILSAIPNFLGSVRSIYHSLSPAQRQLLVGYQSGLDGILIHEVARLRALKVELDAQSTRGGARRQRSKARTAAVHREAITLRNQAVTALRGALGDGDEVVELQVVRGTAETDEELARGLGEVADFIERQRAAADEDERAFLESFGFGPGYVEELRQVAGRLRQEAIAASAADPAERVTENALNLQDGRAMHVVGIIYRAFREGRKRDGTILLPPLGALRSQFENIYRKPASAESPAPSEPSSPSTPPSSSATTPAEKPR